MKLAAGATVSGLELENLPPSSLPWLLAVVSVPGHLVFSIGTLTVWLMTDCIMRNRKKERHAERKRQIVEATVLIMT